MPRLPNQSLDEFQSVRQRTLDLIQPLSQSQLDYAPDPGRWSAGEIVDHILLAANSLQEILEELIALTRSGREPSLRRTFSDFDISFAFVPKSLMPLMELPLSLVSSLVPGALRDFLIQNRLLPFRAAASATPRRGLPASELRSRLTASFDALQSIYDTNSDLNFSAMTAQHPLFGLINMQDLPRLMASHETRHQKQIMDVLANARVPLSPGAMHAR